MTKELITILAAVAGTVVTVALAVLWWINRTPSVSRDSDEPLPLFGGVMDDDVEPNAGVMAGGAVRQQPRVATPVPPVLAVPAPPVAQPSAPPTPAWPPSAWPSTGRQSSIDELATGSRSAFERPRSVPTPESNPNVLTFNTARKATPTGKPAPAPASASTVMSSAGVPGTMIEGQLLRFSVPAEGTLQFLPGRLEIASGVDNGREIRFVRVPGPEGTVVTFGRSEGELYRHIQLRDQTVSRQHARMRLVDNDWYLLNLSQTNPVVQNGRVLANGEERPVSDGDRIEMGEVLFTFRSR